MTLTNLLLILFSIISYISIFEDLKYVDNKLEIEHYKLRKKDNLYKYLLPIIPSLIPVANIITAVIFTENRDKYYNNMKKIKCASLMNNKLKSIYSSLNDNEKNDFEYKLGIANYLINSGMKKNEVLSKIESMYEKDIIYYEINKDTSILEEVEDNYLSDNYDNINFDNYIEDSENKNIVYFLEKEVKPKVKTLKK